MILTKNRHCKTVFYSISNPRISSWRGQLDYRLTWIADSPIPRWVGRPFVFRLVLWVSTIDNNLTMSSMARPRWALRPVWLVESVRRGHEPPQSWCIWMLQYGDAIDTSAANALSCNHDTGMRFKVRLLISCCRQGDDEHPGNTTPHSHACGVLLYCKLQQLVMLH